MVSPQLECAAVSINEAMICFAQQHPQVPLKLEEEEAVFIVGLEPQHTYQVEIDDEEMFEAEADSGGILELDVPRGKPVGVRIKEISPV